MLQIYFVQAKYYIEQFYIVVNISKETNMAYLTGIPTSVMRDYKNQGAKKTGNFKQIETGLKQIETGLKQIETGFNKKGPNSPKALAFESLLEGNLHGSAFLNACETAGISETTASIFVKLVKIIEQKKLAR